MVFHRMEKKLSVPGNWLARFLSRQNHVHDASSRTPPDSLRQCLRPGDVLLVEGQSRISAGIKYLTQSTWSHAALYVGSLGEGRLQFPDHCFVEADLVEGIRSVGIEEFSGYHTRICRPVGLKDSETNAIVDFVVSRLGYRYDLRNILDLARYLLPALPVPHRFRRRMIALGSGDPTKAICSTLIAEAFQSVHYPILPVIGHASAVTEICPDCHDELLHIRDHSLFAPRDFDVSPYFQVVKPMIETGFDFHALKWDVSEAGATPAGP